MDIGFLLWLRVVTRLDKSLPFVGSSVQQLQYKPISTRHMNASQKGRVRAGDATARLKKWLQNSTLLPNTVQYCCIGNTAINSFSVKYLLPCMCVTLSWSVYCPFTRLLFRENAQMPAFLAGSRIGMHHLILRYTSRSFSLGVWKAASKGVKDRPILQLCTPVEA